MKKLSLSFIPAVMQALRPGRRLLALEIAGDKMLAAVAEKKGRKVEVINFVMIDRTNPKDDLPEPANIMEILERLDYRGGPAVLVSPMARSMQISMNRAKTKKLGQHQLRDALRWEVEPYTGISGAQALIGAERGAASVSEDMLILSEDDEEIDVSVTAIENNVFRAMKQIFRRCGLRLVRLYPPDVCFFMPVLNEGEGGAQAVLDIGADYANFTVVRGNQPTQISTSPLGRDVLLDLVDGGDAGEAEQALAFLLKQVPEPLPLMLTGIGATVERIAGYLDGRSPTGAIALELSRIDKLGRAEHGGGNALYAVAAGAAIRELRGSRFRQIGITDQVPPLILLRRSAYVMPLAVSVLLVTGLFLHYGYMKSRKAVYQQQTTELSTQIKEKKQKHDGYKKLEGEISEARDKTQLIRRQIEFLSSGSDDNLRHIGLVLRSFLDLPAAMQLESIVQKDLLYTLEGNVDQEQNQVVGEYAVRLQQQPWCRAARIVSLEHKGGSGGTLNFIMEVTTTTENKDGVAKTP
jgi:hypothetical protein